MREERRCFPSRLFPTSRSARCVLVVRTSGAAPFVRYTRLLRNISELQLDEKSKRRKKTSERGRKDEGGEGGGGRDREKRAKRRALIVGGSSRWRKSDLSGNLSRDKI